jgi:hypothetical protein
MRAMRQHEHRARSIRADGGGDASVQGTLPGALRASAGDDQGGLLVPCNRQQLLGGVAELEAQLGRSGRSRRRGEPGEAVAGGPHLDRRVDLRCGVGDLRLGDDQRRRLDVQEHEPAAEPFGDAGRETRERDAGCRVVDPADDAPAAGCPGGFEQARGERPRFDRAGHGPAAQVFHQARQHGFAPFRWT